MDALKLEVIVRDKVLANGIEDTAEEAWSTRAVDIRPGGDYLRRRDY